MQGGQIAPPAGTADTSTAWLAPTATRAAQLQLILAVPGVPDLTEHARAWPHVFAFARERRSPRSDAATANCTRPFSRGLFGFTPFSDLRADGVTAAPRLALGVISSDPLASLP